MSDAEVERIWRAGFAKCAEDVAASATRRLAERQLRELHVRFERVELRRSRLWPLYKLTLDLPSGTRIGFVGEGASGTVGLAHGWLLGE